MLKILRRLNRKEWALLLADMVFVYAQVWLALEIPQYMTDITQLIINPNPDMTSLWTIGAKMLLCALGNFAAAVVVGLIASLIAAGLAKRLREELYDKVENFAMEDINSFSTASLITRSTNDVVQIQNFFAMGMQVIIMAPFMAVMAIIRIQGTGTWQWTALTGGAVLYLIAVIVFLMLYALPKFRKIQWLTDNLNRITRENLTGLQVVRAYNAEGYQEHKFEIANHNLTSNNLRAQSAMAVLSPTMTLIMSGMTLGIYWLGAYIIDAASLSDKITIFSNMVVFSSYAMQVIMAFVMMTMIFIMLPRASVAAKRINQVLERKPSLKNGTLDRKDNDLEGDIVFDHVYFKYPGAEDYVLKDISFTAHKGETVAFIGATGSGKTTVASLALRFYDATSGKVIIDGHDVKDYDMKFLNSKFGYVPQKAVLFSGTVSSNVAYGDNLRSRPTDDDVRKSVEIAQGKEFVEGLENRYEGTVAQMGANFSGGQKQRIGIARAVCRKPEIYVFDDSFSALDYQTDHVLRQQLKKETSGVTSLIIAQRIGTIIEADRIIVLDEGKVVGNGTHRQLLKTCGIYREIALSQLSKEELA